MQNVIQMALNLLFFLDRSKNRTATEVSPPDLRLCETIELHHFAQLATPIESFFRQKNFNFQAPSFSKILVPRLFVGVSGIRNVDQQNRLDRFLNDQLFLLFFLEHA